jgi:hypothetical protein
MYKICFFVPVAQAEQVKQAIFATGAGRIGDYESCCWQTTGTGQFRPLQGSQPFIGETGQLEQVEELKVELVADDGVVQQAIEALKKAHPYEQPAYEVYKLENF